MYTQNKEEEVILAYFGDRKGNVLDLGANDGKTFSNSLKVIENGWGGLLIEASPETFKKLYAQHENSENVFCYNLAVSDHEGNLKFHESGTHLNKGDTSLLSTLYDGEKSRWDSLPMDWDTITVPCKKWDKILSMSPIKKFNLITIDIEGADWPVLQQMDLNELGCEMLIVEWNRKDKEQYVDFCTKFGMNLIHTNCENLIFVK